MSIIIFSRDVRTGKTTELINRISGLTDVSGILMPVIEGKRMFFDPDSKTFFPAEYSYDKDDRPVEVGPYVFSLQAFEKANEIIIHSVNSGKNYLIIDEAGELELRREGLYRAVTTAISQHKKEQDLIIVVRSELINEVKEFFNLDNAFVITHLDQYPFSTNH